MNAHMVSLDKGLCDAIHSELYEVLKSLHVSNVLNLDDFIKTRGYTPCIASIFLVGEEPCGSFDTTLPSGHTIHVKNGTLSSSIGPDGKESRFVALGKEYQRRATRTN